jgi:CRP/FNR family transcriptional regulator, cyclic AMP receptor protein
MGERSGTSCAEPHAETARDVLAGIPWLLRATPATLDRFVAQGTVQTFRRDEAVCHQGERADALIVILSGTIAISSTAPSGNRHILTHLQTGKLLNLVPLLDGEPIIYDAHAHQQTSVLNVPEPTFQTAIEAERPLADDLMQLLSLRTRMLAGRISDDALMSLPARCAKMLLVLMEHHGVPNENGILIDLKLSQEELSQMLGRSRQSINQEIRKLEEAGIVETSYSRFVIRDVPALTAIAGDY